MRKKNPVRLLLLLLSLSLLVSLNSCNKEQPTAPLPEPEVIISANAHVIDSTTTQRLLSVSTDGSTFTFSPQASAILNLKTNDIMIMQRDQGYLRKVISVLQTTNSIVVQTGDAALTDAIEKGTFADSGALTPADLKSVTNLLHGVILKASVSNPSAFVFQIDNKVIYDVDGNPNTTNDQIRANGSLEINLSRHFEVSIENRRLQRLIFTYGAEENSDLELTTDISFSISQQVEIAHITFATVIIWIVPPPPLPPIPVVITPQLNIYLGIDGNVGASFSVGATQHANFTAGIRYENSSWNSSKNLTNDFSFIPPTLTSTADAKGYAGTSLELLIYGSLAPRATADAYLRLAANPAATPWCNLYGGLEAGLGVSLRVLGHNLVDYSVPDLISSQTLLWSAATPALPSVTTSAASTITSNGAQLNGSVNPNGSATSAWFEYGTGPTLTSYDSSSPQSVGSGTSTVSFNQPIGNLSPATTYYHRIAASNSGGTTRGAILNFTTSGSESIIELKNDDGTCAYEWCWGGACPLSGNLADGNIGFRKFLESPSYPLQVLKVKAYFARKNNSEAGFYLHIKDQSGVDLLPTPFLVAADEVNLGGWWEFDLSSYDIMIESGRIEVGIYESYLLANCPPSLDPSIYGWTICVDLNSRGNSIMKGPTVSFDPGVEFMIRLVAKAPNPAGKIITKPRTLPVEGFPDRIRIWHLSTENRALEVQD